jgi:hypothetical protein
VGGTQNGDGRFYGAASREISAASATMPPNAQQRINPEKIRPEKG